MTELQKLTCKRDGARISALLSACGLRLPGDVDEILGACEGETLLGCAMRRENVILGTAVDASWRGTGLLASLVGALRTEICNLGYDGAFVCTKPETAKQFCSLGFAVLAETCDAALLYTRADGVRRFVATLPKPPWERSAKPVGCVILHANPFTLGHRYLIERAAARCAGLYALVLTGGETSLPLDDRIALVRAGTAELANVCVASAGPFVISLSTFPSYFLKEESDAARVHAVLDATVFATRIAPALGVTVRFVGSEPLDPMTRQYNEALAEILPRHGVEVTEVERLTLSGAPVSASRVRALVERGRIAETEPLVPPATYAYLLRRYGGGGAL